MGEEAVYRRPIHCSHTKELPPAKGELPPRQRFTHARSKKTGLSCEYLACTTVRRLLNPQGGGEREGEGDEEGGKQGYKAKYGREETDEVI